MRRPFIILALTLFAVLFVGIAIDYTERHSLPPLATNYVKRVPQELGAPNIITGILLTYRGFDTLGEVAVLFMVAAGVGLVLGERSPRRRDDVPVESKEITPSTELVQNGAAVLFPLISIFAAYIIMNGHLSAGGGFQGGAIIASGVMLLLLAKPEYYVDLEFLGITESLAGVLYVLVGIAGLMFAGGFLDSRMLPLGQFGAFFSAGAIPIISVLLGVKVGCELSVIIDRFRSRA
jgi:multicomponent Na+:H+ antiporter subunit B